MAVDNRIPGQHLLPTDDEISIHQQWCGHSTSDSCRILPSASRQYSRRDRILLASLFIILVTFSLAVAFLALLKYSALALGCHAKSDADHQQSTTQPLKGVVDAKMQFLQARHFGEIQVGSKTVDVPRSHVVCAANVFLGVDTTTKDRIPSKSGKMQFKTVRGWDDSGDSAFIRPCIKYNQTTGQFTVSQDGIYIMYIHLTFTGCQTDETVMYGHRIMRDGFSEPLLTDLQAVKLDEDQGDVPYIHTSVSVAAVRLRSGQRLHVEAKPKNCLYRGNHLSYFGLAKQTGDYSKE